MNTQIPSDPPELQAVLVVYVEQLALGMQIVPLETQDDKATKHTFVDVPFWISAQLINLHLAVLLLIAEAGSQKQIPSDPTAVVQAVYVEYDEQVPLVKQVVPSDVHVDNYEEHV